jgi:uncharacterized protein (DUF2132 family)
MTDDINYKNNPLHGLGLKNLLIEMVDHYGFEILFAYLNVHCFKTNPSIESSVKFLKKTDWAREKVEAFYLYQFKSLPKASSQQFDLPPRDRVIPENQIPGEPKELSLEDAERLREQKAKQAANWNKGSGNKRTGASNNSNSSENRSSRSKPSSAGSAPKAGPSSTPTKDGKVDPWGNWKKSEE